MFFAIPCRNDSKRGNVTRVQGGNPSGVQTMHYEDIELSCVQCGEKFTFTKTEQQHWAKRGFAHKPKRCKKCREERRSKVHDYAGSTYGQGQGIYRAPSFRNERSFKSEYRSPMDGGGGSWKHAKTQDHEITCSKCGARDTIPFRPLPGRDVFCHACYEDMKRSGTLKKHSKAPVPESVNTEEAGAPSSTDDGAGNQK